MCTTQVQCVRWSLFRSFCSKLESDSLENAFHTPTNSTALYLLTADEISTNEKQHKKIEIFFSDCRSSSNNISFLQCPAIRKATFMWFPFRIHSTFTPTTIHRFSKYSKFTTHTNFQSNSGVGFFSTRFP